jgi:branched-chain amino acid transport system substrate-binding protein
MKAYAARRSLWLGLVMSFLVSACLGASTPTAATQAGPTAATQAGPTAATQAGPTAASTQVAVKEIKIGVPFPLSGSLASSGNDSKIAVELAADIVNHVYDLDLPLARTTGLPNLGGATVVPVFADHAMDPLKAANETERLITEEKVVAIDGAWASSTTATASQVAERLGIPLLNAESTSPALGEQGFKWFFRTTPTDKVFVRSLFDFMRDMVAKKGVSIKTIAILHEDTAYGTDTADLAKALAVEYGYEIVADIAYPQNATDATSEIQRIKAANPDVLLQADYTSNAILTVLAYRQLDLNVKAIIANDNGFSDQQYIAAVKDAGNYIYSRDVWSTDWVQNNPRVSKINDLYKARAGKDLTGTSARSFTGFMVLAEAINRAGSTDPEKIRQALLGTNLAPTDIIMPWQGVRFDPQTHENVLGNGIVVQMQQGAYYNVWPFEFAARQPIWPMPAWKDR